MRLFAISGRGEVQIVRAESPERAMELAGYTEPGERGRYGPPDEIEPDGPEGVLLDYTG